MISKARLGILISLASLFLLGCNKSEETSGSKFQVILKSSDIKQQRIGNFDRANIVLKNITGQIDSVVFPINEFQNCGYVVYQANGQTGLIGAPGRTYEAFDLSSPPTWYYNKGDLKCSGGTSSRFNILAAYLDILFTIDGTEKTIRVALGNYNKYKLGDVLIKSGESFNWVDPPGTTLTSDSNERPSNVAQISGIASSSIPEGKILASMNIGVVDSNGATAKIALSESTIKVIIDVKLKPHGISISDSSTNAKIASTFTMSALANFSSDGLAALLTTE